MAVESEDKTSVAVDQFINATGIVSIIVSCGLILTDVVK